MGLEGGGADRGRGAPGPLKLAPRLQTNFSRMSPLQPTLLLRRLAAAALRGARCDACGDGLLRLRGGGPRAPSYTGAGWAILFGGRLRAREHVVYERGEGYKPLE